LIEMTFMEFNRMPIRKCVEGCGEGSARCVCDANKPFMFKILSRKSQ